MLEVVLYCLPFDIHIACVPIAIPGVDCGFSGPDAKLYRETSRHLVGSERFTVLGTARKTAGHLFSEHGSRLNRGKAAAMALRVFRLVSSICSFSTVAKLAQAGTIIAKDNCQGEADGKGIEKLQWWLETGTEYCSIANRHMSTNGVPVRGGDAPLCPMCVGAKKWSVARATTS